VFERVIEEEENDEIVYGQDVADEEIDEDGLNVDELEKLMDLAAGDVREMNATFSTTSTFKPSSSISSSATSCPYTISSFSSSSITRSNTKLPKL
jgi:hypothetical protein